MYGFHFIQRHLHQHKSTAVLTPMGEIRDYPHPMITSISPVAHAGALRRNVLAAVLASIALAACSASTQTASNRDRVPGQAAAIAAANADDHTNPWAANCYAQFERDVLKLAGERSVNCGLLRLDATEAQKDEVEQCARSAEKLGRPYRAGQVGIDVADTYIACDVAIRDTHGQRWRLWYDFDLDDRQSQGKSDGVVTVSRCNSIAFQPGTLLTHSFFELGGCQEAPSIVASPIAAGAP
jgi:hypothetical protein